MKHCPFCAEEIQDAAVKCKHCGEFLPESVKPKSALPIKPVPPRPTISFDLPATCALVCIVGFSVLLLLSVFGSKAATRAEKQQTAKNLQRISAGNSVYSGAQSRPPQKPKQLLYAKREDNIRTGPGADYGIARKTRPLEPLEFTSFADGWYQISEEEWVHESVVYEREEGQRLYEEAAKRSVKCFRIAADGAAILLEEPTFTDYNELKIASVPPSTQLSLDDWVNINAGVGSVRFLKTTYKGKQGWLIEHYTDGLVLQADLQSGAVFSETKISELTEKLDTELEARIVIRAFFAKLKTIQSETGIKLVENIDIVELSDSRWEIEIAVKNEWHTLPYQYRLQWAQVLSRTWADSTLLKNRDGARVRFVDIMGNEVGGTKWSGEIWVQK